MKEPCGTGQNISHSVQRTEVRDQRSEDGGQRTEDRGQRAEGRDPSSVFRLPSSVFRLPSSVFRLPSSVFRLPTSDFRHQKIITLTISIITDTYISGSQDSIGIVFPGVNKLDYPKGAYWPEKITPVTDEETLAWIERHLWFINLSPRGKEFNVLSGTCINYGNVKNLADAAESVWRAIQKRDIRQFGQAFRQSFEAQVKMFPHMVNPTILKTIELFKDQASGWKISGAGGGGYLVLVSEEPIKNALQIRIRR